MPRRGRRPTGTIPPETITITPNPEDPNWWQNFLKSRGFLTETPITKTTTPMMTRETPSLSPEQRIFAERLIYALCPPDKGYAPIIVKKVKEIYNVLEGTKDFAEWFTETRKALNLKSYQLAKVIYDCLDGLRSPEARQLREQWYQYLVAEMRGYGLV